MRSMNLAEIASIAGGAVHGSDHVVVDSVSIDTRSLRPGALFAALRGAHVDGHDLIERARAAGATAALTTREVAMPCVIVPDVTRALGRIARNSLDGLDELTVIGITGSQGKTSAKDLIAAVLSRRGATVASAGSFNNELGVPLTVLEADAQTRFLVVEMGSRGMGHIATLCEIAPPDISVVLNVGSAHIGEFGSADNIARAKGELVEALPPTGTAVLNADDVRVAAMASRTDARVITFGRHADVSLGEVVLDPEGRPHFVLAYAGEQVATSVPQIGAHHAYNAAAAAAVGIAAGMGIGDIGAALREAIGVSPMRMARLVREDGVVIINDAYNANPESMEAALRAVVTIRRDGRTYAVLGEMLELGERSAAAHRAIGELAAELGIDHVVVVGEGAAEIAEGAGDRAQRVSDVGEAVSFLTERLQPLDVVIVKASRAGRLERVVDGLTGR